MGGHKGSLLGAEQSHSSPGWYPAMRVGQEEGEEEGMGGGAETHVLSI